MPNCQGIPDHWWPDIWAARWSPLSRPTSWQRAASFWSEPFGQFWIDHFQRSTKWPYDLRINLHSLSPDLFFPSNDVPIPGNGIARNSFVLVLLLLRQRHLNDKKVAARSQIWTLPTLTLTSSSSSSWVTPTPPGGHRIQADHPLVRKILFANRKSILTWRDRLNFWPQSRSSVSYATNDFVGIATTSVTNTVKLFYFDWQLRKCYNLIRVSYLNLWVFNWIHLPWTNHRHQYKFIEDKYCKFVP